MLSERLSQRLAQWLLKKQSIQEKEYEVYCYCLDYMIQLLLFCVVIEMLGMIGKELVFSSLFLLILIPMRSICGGIHAGMHLKREERMPIFIWSLIIVMAVERQLHWMEKEHIEKPPRRGTVSWI